MKILQKFHSNSSFVDTLLGVWIMKNDREKICEERNVARIGEKIVQIQTPNLYDPSFNSLSFAISSAILHEITIIFSFPSLSRANVSIFSWRNTLDRRKDVRKYGNRAEKRARLPRIVLIRPRLRQFPTEFSNRFEFPCEFSPREKFLPIFTEKNMGPRKASPKR